MQSGYTYVGLDVHKKTITWCAKKIDGTRVGQDSRGQALHSFANKSSL